MPESVLRHLNRIDREAAGRIGVEAPIPSAERDRYILSSLIEEAITSSQLEGASTARRVAKQMLREGRKPRDKNERMIFNNFLAMRQIRDIAGSPLTTSIVMELHRLLTHNTLEDPADAGRLRSTDDIQIMDHRDNTVLHHPPRADELAPASGSALRLCQRLRG